MKTRPIKQILVLTLSIVALVLAVSCSADDMVKGRVLVRLVAGVDEAKFLSDYNTSVQDRVSSIGCLGLRIPAGFTEAQFVAKLDADLRVLYVELDRYLFSGVPLAPGGPTPPTQPTIQYHYAFDGGSSNTAYLNQFAYNQVHLGTTHTLTKGRGVIVAVLDTGVALTHPALVKNLVPGYNAIDPSKTPADVPDGIANAGAGHGTMIAGIITRLAPEVSIMPVRVLNGDGVGRVMDIAKGVEYAVNHGARVINLSLGGVRRSDMLKLAMDLAESRGVVTVAASGNDGLEMEQYPAKGNGTIAVGAVESDNTKAPYSNYGSFIRVVAPGTNIRSTYYDGYYANWTGTSFAVPFVAAEAALIIGKVPTISSNGVKEAIRGTARSVDNVNDPYKGKLGKGLIDIEAAVKSAH
jgi:subtilisin family serine protease